MSEPVRTEIPENMIQNESAHVQMPMHWHGFLIKCMLWLAAAVHILQAAWIFTGKIYYTPEIRAQIYAGIPTMRILDYILAVCFVVSAALQIAARGKLKKLQGKGVRLLISAYVVLAASQLAYALARFIFAGLSPLNIPVIAQVLAYAALLLVNRSYYARRRSAFERSQNENG